MVIQSLKPHIKRRTMVDHVFYGNMLPRLEKLIQISVCIPTQMSPKQW